MAEDTPFQRYPQSATGTFWTDALALAESIYARCDEQFGTEWRRGRSSIVSRDWNFGFESAAKRLLFLAFAINRYARTMTADSAPAIDHKIRALLTCNNEAQFREDLGELVIGGFLGDIAGPIVCDPFVRPLSFVGPTGALRPDSCDFAILLPNGETPTDILIDVTTLNFGHYGDWLRAVEEVSRRIEVQIDKAGLHKQLSFSASLGIKAHAPYKSEVTKLIQEMRDKASGRRSLALPGGQVEVTWSPLEVFEIQPGEFPTGFTGRAAAFHTSGACVHSAVSVHHELLPASSDEETILKSLRRVIAGKKVQLARAGDEAAPTAVFLQNASAIIPDSYMERLIRTRIWPNQEFSWLSGLAIFRVTEDYSDVARTLPITVTTNPNAQLKMPASFVEALTGEAIYHRGVLQDSQPSARPLDSSPQSSL